MAWAVKMFGVVMRSSMAGACAPPRTREPTCCGTTCKENAVMTPTAVVRTSVELSCSTSCAMRRERDENACLMTQEVTAWPMG